MENPPDKLYLGSVPGNLSVQALEVELRLQLVSFVKVETNKSNTRDKMVKNKGYAFMTISDPAEYKMLLSKEKVLTIGDRTIKVSKYQPGSVSKSEKLLAASRKICIKGLPGWVTDKDLRMAFQASGLFPDTIFRAQKNSTREDLPFGFAEFSEQYMAEMALNFQRIPLASDKETYLIVEKFKDKSVKDQSPNRDQPAFIEKSIDLAFQRGSTINEVIASKPQLKFGENQQKLKYNKVLNPQGSSISEYPSPNRQIESPDSSPGHRLAKFTVESSDGLPKRAFASQKHSVFPSIFPKDYRHLYHSLPPDGSKQSEGSQYAVRQEEASVTIRGPKRSSSNRSVSWERFQAEETFVHQPGILHHHSSADGLLPSRPKASLPYKEILDKDSEPTRLTKPWLDSVKDQAPGFEMDHPDFSKNLRFNVNISPLRELYTNSQGSGPQEPLP